MLTRGIWDVAEGELDEVRQELADLGYRTFLIGPGITDKSAFFQGLKSRVPLDPLLHANESWDALSDSLWGGLDSVPQHNIAIIWSGADAMAKASPNDFATAKDILSQLTESLADPELTVDNAKMVLVILSSAVPQ